MRPAHRWAVVAGSAALLVVGPIAVRAWPADDSDVSAAELLTTVQGNLDHPYSGYVEAQGTLLLPVADRFTDVGELFGSSTRLRVWWRSADEWRVDRLLATGETDLIHNAQGTTRWRYEQNDADLSHDPDIRLPRTADLVPPEVADLMLSDAEPSEVSRLSAARVAGRDALGLRLRPGARQTSIDHVDVWADADSGVVLRAVVVGKGSGKAAFTTEFADFSPVTPPAERTRFVTPPGADFEFDDVLDIADAANQYAPVVPPDRVAGLVKGPASDRAVGVYGSGATRLIAIPLRGREAEPLREQLRLTPGVREEPQAALVMIGPLGVALGGSGGDGGWLVAGTVTPDTLLRAVRDLYRGMVIVGDER
ncbi:transcriptional regulator [Nocardioides agariphilus]|uniref:Transcriptional regulator n=1 Tax=Nocardioides agariphilus TaxID=433664 RepID=A0A930VH36_9ACTN|nr:transcriptional regulator [Nocardioides agariphilus]MBF4766472.1 transcriptional regulator [Nocardioides agariphilus]